MIDTITLFHPRPRLVGPPPPGWNHSFFSKSKPNLPEGLKQSFSFDDPVSGYHGCGSKGEVRYHRVSLPRLLHGQNGRLIQSQFELDAAFALLKAKAAEIGDDRGYASHFTRVDLVWQFSGDPALFIKAHRNCRHPQIHRDPHLYEARSLVLKGSEMRIKIYDKTNQRFKRPGNIVGVEIQLRGRALQEHLGAGDVVKTLNFDACYQAYRRIMLGFVPSQVPTVVNIAHLLSLAEREQWQADGVTAFDLYTHGMSERNARQLKQQMAAARPAVLRIDWAALLPPDGPPMPVELTEN